MPTTLKVSTNRLINALKDQRNFLLESGWTREYLAHFYRQRREMVGNRGWKPSICRTMR